MSKDDRQATTLERRRTPPSPECRSGAEDCRTTNESNENHITAQDVQQRLALFANGLLADCSLVPQSDNWIHVRCAAGRYVAGK
jgi:hypothetical protein